MNSTPDALPNHDPFFEVVARRHPDIDLVLIDSTRSSTEPVSDEILAGIMIEVSSFARELWGTAAGSDEEPVARFVFGDRPDTVRAEARCRVEFVDGAAVIARLAGALAASGWEVVTPRSGSLTVRTERASTSVTASHIDPPGVVLFRVTGPPMSVGNQRASELTRNGGR